LLGTRNATASTPKKQVTLRLAPKVIRHFKQAGIDWQTRVNELEGYVVKKTGGTSHSMHAMISGASPMARNQTTGKKAGTAAPKVCGKSSGKASKTAAGSALTQRPDRKRR
jgi:hypothetical protein